MLFNLLVCLMLGLPQISTNLRSIYELKNSGFLVYNWPSNKIDLRSHHNRLVSSQPLHPFVSLKTGAPESQTQPDHRDILVINLRLTCDALRPISDRPMTLARPPWVTCLTRQKFARDKDFKSDLRLINDRAELHTRASNDLRPTWED